MKWCGGLIVVRWKTHTDGRTDGRARTHKHTHANTHTNTHTHKDAHTHTQGEVGNSKREPMI